jgi:outer membrane immunogenic protein
MIGAGGVAAHANAGGLDYLGTVRGRLGWLFTPTLLVYGTGGFAYGGASLNISQMSYDDAGFFGAGFGVAGRNVGATGWTAGGLEWMFMPNWSAKAEYLYYDLGTISANLGPVAGLNLTAFAVPGSLGFANVSQVSTRVSGNVVRAGVNYHFSWGAAASTVASY